MDPVLDAVREFDDKMLESAIAEHKTVVVDFYADYVSLCENTRIAFDSLVGEMSDVVFGRLDIGSNGKSPLKYGVTHLPSMLIFSEGRLREIVEGSWPKPQLKYRIQKYL